MRPRAAARRGVPTPAPTLRWTTRTIMLRGLGTPGRGALACSLAARRRTSIWGTPYVIPEGDTEGGYRRGGELVQWYVQRVGEL